jgi:hypothetical protein
MKGTILGLAAALLAAGCSGNASSNASNASNAANAAATSVVTATTSSVPAASPTPQFTDLSGYFGADKIDQLALLHVFDGIEGPAFEPNKPVLRREFVRWLFAANNVIQDEDAKKVRPAPPGEPAFFKDVPDSDKDFTPIQGMQDSGISVGFPDQTFRPDQPVTREQALALALGVNCSYDGNWSKTPNQAYEHLPAWKDKDSVSKSYAPIIATCAMQNVTGGIVGRVWGKTTVFQPQTPLTRGEAALMIWQSGARTAADALAATPSPPPSP